MLPLLTSRNVELLDDRRLVGQLLVLERRTSWGGRDSVDHPPGGYDDLINAALGALELAWRYGPTPLVPPSVREELRIEQIDMPRRTRTLF